MRRVRKFALVMYLLAGIIVVGAFAGSLFGPYTDRFRALLLTPAGHVLIGCCLVVLGVQMLAVLFALLFDKPEPASMRLEGNPDIEVCVDALTSVARNAAASPDVMIERVEARVAGRDKREARVKIDAVALAPQNLEGLAHRVQAQVQEACDQMLGVPGAVVQVRFLPSKTITVTKEIADTGARPQEVLVGKSVAVTKEVAGE